MYNKIDLFCNDLDTTIKEFIKLDDYFGSYSTEIQKRVEKCMIML
ncbi:hypothetical protein [Campylobacter insulaenigrae]|nr:hypothetical protein [Campylobacter insulaenigrae]MCR6580347.1 hypothetical protein [Campylobacter insulaenigrae]